MLTNFVTDNHLKNYHPQLARQLWVGNSTYAAQIDEAFQRVMVDISNKGINPRLVMVPLYLTDSYVVLAASTTGSTSTESDYNLKRFVVDVTAINGSHTVSVEGTDDSTTWISIGSIPISVIGTHNLEFTPSFKYWRYVFTKVTGTGATIRCSLVENIWDKLITYKTFILIFSDFRKEERDSWDLLVAQYERTYVSYLDSLKFLYDASDDGTIDGDDVTSMSYQTYL